ncbi:MAG TPA: PAS domain-containing protein [Chryseosolibacter sp.]
MNSEMIPPNTEASKAVIEIDLLSQLQQSEAQRQQLQSEFNALKDRFNYVMKATQDAVWDWDLVNNTGWYNEGLSIFGYNASHIHDGVKFWHETIHPDDKDRVLTGIHAVVDNGGQHWHDRYRFRRANGTYAWVFDRGYGIHDANGKPIRMVGSIQDITLEVEAKEALRESEEKFRGAFDQVAVGISIASPEGQFLSVNQAYPKIFGFTHEELMNKRIQDLSHPDELDGDRKIFSQLLSGQTQVAARVKRYIHKSGKIVWGRVFGTVIWGSNGAPKYIVGVLEDITEQREIDQALQENEERLRLVIDSANIGTWDFNPLTGHLHWDVRCKELFGMSPDDHADYEVFLQRVHPDDREAADKANRDAINGIGNGEYDLEYRTIGLRDQKLRWVRAKGRGYKDVNGQPIRYAGTAIDITEQKMQEQRLREQEQRFRLLATSIPQIVWTTDEEGSVNYMSDKWVMYTGHTPTYEKFSFPELMHPEDKAKVVPAWTECVKAGSAYQAEFRLKNIETNQYRWFSCTIAPLKDESGKAVKWIGSATDIQEQKMVEQDLENKVSERTKELLELNERLERSNSELEQYAYVTSHDLKEPLRKIQTYSNIITTKYPKQISQEVTEYLQKIESASLRMSGLIDDLLKYSRLSDANVMYDSVNLGIVVNNIVTEFEYTLKQKNIVVHMDKLPVLKGVPIQMHQLFQNLFSNAIKFSKPNRPNKIIIKSALLTDNEKSLHPALTSRGRHYKITFEDEGIGFSPQYSEQVFTIFQRLNNRNQFEGHGIGLALCRKIVSNHRGYISASGEENIGAKFTIILPERF